MSERNDREDSPGSKNVYCYQPLNEAEKQIRIFRLAPGKAGEPVRGTLSITSINRFQRSKGPIYHDCYVKREPSSDINWNALSYVWGSFARNKILIISSKTLAITQSLCVTLQYLRDPDKGRFLWIDQICINQEDENERAYQVQLMQEIYRRATDVIAWLGPGTTAVRDMFCAIASIELISRGPNTIEYIVKMQLSTNSEKQNLLQVVLHLDDIDFNPKQALRKLCKGQDEMMGNAWFNRLWTLQEAVLNYTLHFQAGRQMVLWEDVFLVFSLLINFRSAHGIPNTDEPYEKLMTIKIYRQHHAGIVDESLYSLTRYSIDSVREASDLRDYVYGQLGIWNPRATDFVKPGYSASVETFSWMPQ
ncbi:hypothetical protein OEA41_000112 [Lepraria neglecta]|uniref:Heterokaryon incompatibility domain-containing protein n=1 Tax=Lepraria neglecta TaxID=209136 RepID=A0AAD9ZFD8_9LECA|nr:hypothetical protein OEA41_000112 [Lepraria neglecta]